MSSPRSSLGAAPRREGVLQVLDLAFGFFVWAGHFLAVYVATAVACVLGLGGANEGSRSVFMTVLALATIAAAAVLLLHALRRYRQRHTPDVRFRMAVAVGGDAIAAVAVLWQLFPILLVPACA